MQSNVVYSLWGKCRYGDGKYEDIFAYCAIGINRNTSNKIRVNYNTILTVVTLQFIIVLKNKIHKIVKAVYLRNTFNKETYMSAVKTLLVILIDEIRRISSALYYREIYK